MRRRIVTICVFAAFGALAEDGGKRTPPNTTTISVSNNRAVALQQFEIYASASDAKTERLIGRLPKPLPAGERASVPLSKAKGCVFQARWSFTDAKDAGEVDLCNGANIVLVD